MRRHFNSPGRMGTTCLLALLAASCAAPNQAASKLRIPAEARRATGSTGTVRLLRTPGGESVTLETAVRELAGADVVFLGEQHDNADGHAVQLALTQGLGELRGDLILSMEMFERDAQPALDLYLSGALSEDEFKGTARLWPNYEEHYRGAVEYCREEGFEVLAANVYRPIASRVARAGLAAGIGDPWAARHVSAPRDGEYRRRFNEVMGGHGENMEAAALDDIFAAQCIKDDTMAESIADALSAAEAQERSPVIVHWNGRFHSDFGLGTVERLRSRRPDLNIAVVSMLERTSSSAELTKEELDQGHYLILVPPASQ